MANKHMKRDSALLIIKEMEVEFTLRYHFTSVKVAIVERTI